MDNKIKEIINDLQRVADRKCYPEDILCGSIAQEWVDYITDLQEERNDYKSRNEKAIEYINNGRDDDYCDALSANELLSILGSDKE